MNFFEWLLLMFLFFTFMPTVWRSPQPQKVIVELPQLESSVKNVFYGNQDDDFLRFRVNFSSRNHFIDGGDMEPVIYAVEFGTTDTKNQSEYVIFRDTPTCSFAQLRGTATDYSTNNEIARVYATTGTVPVLFPFRAGRTIAFKPSSSSIPHVTVIYKLKEKEPKQEGK